MTGTSVAEEDAASAELAAIEEAYDDSELGENREVRGVHSPVRGVGPGVLGHRRCAGGEVLADAAGPSR